MALTSFPALTNARLARRFWQPLFDDPAVRAHFQAHAGKTACVTVLGATLHYEVGADGAISIVAPDDGSGDPDLNLVIPLAGLQALIARDEQWRTRIHQDLRDVCAESGCPAFADDFLSLWQSVPMLLEHWGGKVMPAPLFEAMRRAGANAKGAIRDLGERLTEQKRDAVARVLTGNEEARAVAQQLQNVAQRCETLEAQLQSLEKRLHSR